tara:strand:+ start:1104 stop:1529 length:426 start_codon:yes stop_codon:yes gene_type:complete
MLCIFVLIGCQKNDIDILNGKNTNIDELKGQWIVVNYWADWCAPCIKEIPEINDFANENEDIKVFAFNFDYLEKDDLKPLVNKFNIQFPSLISHPKDIWLIETPPAIPATYFIDPNGNVKVSLIKPQTKESLTNILSDVRN